MKKINFKFLIYIFFVATAINLTSTNNFIFSQNSNQPVKPVSIYYNNGAPQYLLLSLQLNYPLTDPIYSLSPSFCYTGVKEFNPHILNNNHYSSVQGKIIQIGIQDIEEIINEIINREIEYNNDYLVLYHGQKREFIAIQDLYAKLYEFFNNTKLNDFIFVRIPSKDFDNFKSPADFIKCHKNQMLKNSYPYEIFDHDVDVKKHILPVNISLFGNSVQSINKYISECTFKYFIHSANITYTYAQDFCEELFNVFNLSQIFQNYKPEILDLINLLSTYEQSKTGNLLQIFIPKNLVNKILYRSTKGGACFYTLNPSSTPQTPQALLSSYAQKLISDSLCTFITSNQLEELDEIQFRILITNKFMLNPKSGIKIFRYTNKTPNMKLYEIQLEQLVTQMIKNMQNL